MYFKTPKIRSKKITKSAKGESCTLNTPHCNGDSSTVVFCHAPSELKGIATKSDDFWGCYGCSDCHRYVDEIAGSKQAESYWLRAIFRTQKRLFEKEILTVN